MKPMLNKETTQESQARFYPDKRLFPSSTTLLLNSPLPNTYSSSLTSNTPIRCNLILINKANIIIPTIYNNHLSLSNGFPHFQTHLLPAAYRHDEYA